MPRADARVRLVYPHQLFRAQLDVPSGTRHVLVEDDLFFRQYRFHAHKLVLHRASMARFADLLRSEGFDPIVVESSADTASADSLTKVLRTLHLGEVTVYDVVDDWLFRDCAAAVRAAGGELRDQDVLETPNFLTTRAQLQEWFGDNAAQMQYFYRWQRKRLDILLDHGHPVGGKWSFDPENRKKLPRGHPVPEPVWPERTPAVQEAIEWADREFPDAPGDPATFVWPTSHEEAEAAYDLFLAERFVEFGPYEDAISKTHPVLFHAALSPSLNLGLLDPGEVVHRALDAAHEYDVPLASLEGFVRQVIGWREYMRATYQLYGRRMRGMNALHHTRSLDDGWWTGHTGLGPVDHVIGQVLERGWAHHIERLMVLGNAMCLLRIDPEEIHEWFMAMFVDAYDWVMVPNVYAMSQYSTGPAITTKPYVSGSNYLRKMSDLPRGDWDRDWDALYWTFVADHRDVFDSNRRSQMMTRMWDGMDPAKKSGHVRRARRLLA
ncbi:cryptochrome/photolyase family protein [Allobranchiibius sp. GilTou73]|uniref:cryptochrome/photolyase family protein n=1 Tax=Allobranchiibius sp. GilTou73 TaxID=2904523 RepID=UPI001F2730E7|nr:cryptochrome/photolyase family protein [Allobranchiibius sp. GilTou73]UIJ35369.1 cryptochrome/photolyase family protein [Allobranchiibius sp. GilTou73]